MAQERQIVKDLLAQFFDARANNATPLGVDMLEQMRGKNGGYPRFLYHSVHEPVQVTNKEQETALSQRGYVRDYRRHNYPRTLYRRNLNTVKTRILDSKEFEDVPKFPDFVETIVARTKEHEEEIANQRTPDKCSAWVDDMSLLPEIDSGPGESKDATIARLRGQLEALQSSGEALPMPEGALSHEERKERKKKG
jgi:hypothetical protein